MKPIITVVLALLAGCAGISGSGGASSGSSAAADVPLYVQNPANTERSFSPLR